MKNKLALVTGASRGIGREIALEFAEQGSDLVLISSRESDALKQTKKDCEEKNVNVITLTGDVSDEEFVIFVFDEIKEKFGKIDILVNNAGICRDNLIIRMTSEDFERVLDVNLKGAFLFMKYASKLMIRKRYGKIINISSVVGISGNKAQVNYAASKGGLIAASKSLAKELASRNINVNAVAPGFIKSDMTDALPDEAKDAIKTQIAMNRLGETKDIAKAVSFLASDDSSYITGQVISVCGGMSM